MTCNACGENQKKTCDGFTKAVIEINNPETLILLRKVVIPASMGTDEDVPAAVGKYHNVILHYEANKHTYLYSSDGIPTLLETDIPQEVLDRITALEDGLADESEIRGAADAELQSNIDAVASDLATEASTRADADTALGTRIDGVVNDLATETSDRQSADATLQSNIDTVASNLATEASTRADADTALGTRIDGVASDLATETSNRESADATLQSNITAETTARTNADATLQTDIDNLSTALTTETTNRTNADTALGTRIDGVAGDLATETTNRQTADTNLQTAISNEATTRANADTSLQNALSIETTARQTADTGLQSQIDAIVASSDVKDIVGTYAALQQYDTSTLGDNDIIKVLQDETHSDETTYYRWSTATSTFTLIGEEGPYYTKSVTDALLNTKADKATTYTKTEVDTALATKQDNLIAGTNISIASDGKTISATDTTYTAGTGLNLTGTQFSVDTTTVATQSDLTTGLATKQNTLTAGSNVQISNDTISATDTTYSPFTGTDGTTAGTSGLVPAPATADAGKVLGANGGWVTGGPTVVQAIGTSTTDVMSQDAVTNLIFTDDTYYKQIAIGYGAKTGGPSNGDAYSTAVGFGAFAGGTGTTLDSSAEATAIGAGSCARGKYGTAIGRGAKVNRDGLAKADGGVSIGAFAIAYGTGIAIGGGPASSSGVVSPASANGDGTIAIGIGAKVNNLSGTKGAIALGAGASTGTTGVMSINTSDTSYGYRNSNYRLLTGLYDPQSAHDAATKGYVDPSTSTTAPTTSTAGRLGKIRIDTSTNTAYMCVSADSTTSTYVWKQITA